MTIQEQIEEVRKKINVAFKNAPKEVRVKLQAEIDKLNSGLTENIKQINEHITK
jgi:hypothetical protein